MDNSESKEIVKTPKTSFRTLEAPIRNKTTNSRKSLVEVIEISSGSEDEIDHPENATVKKPRAPSLTPKTSYLSKKYPVDEGVKKRKLPNFQSGTTPSETRNGKKRAAEVVKDEKVKLVRESSDIFFGKHAVWIPDVQNKRGAILKDRFVERGREVSMYIYIFNCQFSCELGGIVDVSFKQGTTDYIITDYSEQRVLQKLHLIELPSKVEIVTYDWLSRSIILGKVARKDSIEPSQPQSPTQTKTSPPLSPKTPIVSSAENTPSPPSSPIKIDESDEAFGAELLSGDEGNHDLGEEDEMNSEDENVGYIIDLKTGKKANFVNTVENVEKQSDVNEPRKLFKGQSTYICMHPNLISMSSPTSSSLPQESTAASPSPPTKYREANNKNEKLTTIFEKLMKQHESEGEQWRVLSYRKAINALKKHPKEIQSGKEAREIPGVGSKIADKIDEILETGKLKKIENAPAELKVLEEFMTVHGVGRIIAKQWYSKGFRSLDDVRNAVENGKLKLSHDQEIGMRYVEEFKARIPRFEMIQLSELVIKEAKKINSKLEIHVMGSFRRGAQDCGDIDLILTHPDGVSHAASLPPLLHALRKVNFLSDDLSHQDPKEKSPFYKGVCCLGEGSIHRRIDILVVPYDELGAALIHFTGNDVFNRSIRHLAGRMNMRLNQHGLFRNVLRGKARAKLNEGERIAGRTEERTWSPILETRGTQRIISRISTYSESDIIVLDFRFCQYWSMEGTNSDVLMDQNNSIAEKSNINVATEDPAFANAASSDANANVSIQTQDNNAKLVEELYYHYYLRTSETNYLYESYVFYEATRERAYFRDVLETKSPALVIKKLRYYARFIVVCLLLNRTAIIKKLMSELSTLVEEYTKQFKPADSNEWNTVIQEIETFLEAERKLSPIDLDNEGSVLVSKTRLQSSSSTSTTTASSTKDEKAKLRLQEAILVGNFQNQIKFSELTLDMYRMLQSLEREPNVNAANNAGAMAPPEQSEDGTNAGAKNANEKPKRSNPHKYLLYRPTLAQLMLYVATTFKDISENAAVMLYLSADGAKRNAKGDDTAYTGGVATNVNYSRKSSEQKVDPDQLNLVHCLHPQDLVPFTRKPLFVVIDSTNSTAFKNFPKVFSQSVVILMSPTEYPSGIKDTTPIGNLFTLFLHSPIKAIAFICSKSEVKGSVWESAIALVTSLEEIARDLISTNANVDKAYKKFIQDDFLRQFIARFVLATAIFQGHTLFKDPKNIPSSYPSLPQTLFTTPELISKITDLIGLLDVSSQFNFNVGGTTGSTVALATVPATTGVTETVSATEAMDTDPVVNAEPNPVVGSAPPGEAAVEEPVENVEIKQDIGDVKMENSNGAE
ncbi:hypothetical protein HK098_001456 [Nowakowskiella sp. JEL0407]|nr:hypothetical protein HK098_001456 [Nowakowskiella sp. JEL0407]